MVIVRYFLQERDYVRTFPWATIRRKKGAANAKRGQVFTRLAREIVIAAREGGATLIRTYIAICYRSCSAQNMPKENIEGQ